MAIYNPYRTMTYIRAKTPDKLQEAMLRNNLSNQAEYVYSNIQFVQGFWFAWYLKDIKNQIQIKQPRKEVSK